MLADQLPDEVEIRAGPAGLRNLGATCYVSPSPSCPATDGLTDNRPMRFCKSGTTTVRSEKPYMPEPRPM